MDESRCPYCNTLLEKKPVRKKKCPHCKNYIFVRRGHLMTMDQVKDYEAQQQEEWNRKKWMERLGTYGVTEKTFERSRKKLSKEFGRPASTNDTVWRILNEQITKTKDYFELKMIYLDMAEVLRCEGKKTLSVLENASRMELLQEKKAGIVQYVTVSTANDDHVCEACRALENQPIEINRALKELPVPRVCTNEGGCRCGYSPVVDYGGELDVKKKRKKRFLFF